MTALIARLEAATEGSRELDAEIWKMCAHEKYNRMFWDCRSSLNRDLSAEEKNERAAITAAQYSPHYTTSIDVALPGEDIHRVERVQSPTVTWWKAYQGIHIGQGKTEALARRIAALKARSAP